MLRVHDGCIVATKLFVLMALEVWRGRRAGRVYSWVVSGPLGLSCDESLGDGAVASGLQWSGGRQVRVVVS